MGLEFWRLWIAWRFFWMYYIVQLLRGYLLWSDRGLEYYDSKVGCSPKHMECVLYLGNQWMVSSIKRFWKMLGFLQIQTRKLSDQMGSYCFWLLGRNVGRFEKLQQPRLWFYSRWRTWISHVLCNVLISIWWRGWIQIWEMV